MANESSNVVVDRAQSHWSDLWKKEDYWAIWLGFALLIAAICIFINGAPASYKETIDKSNAIMKVEAEKALHLRLSRISRLRTPRRAS